MFCGSLLTTILCFAKLTTPTDSRELAVFNLKVQNLNRWFEFRFTSFLIAIFHWKHINKTFFSTQVPKTKKIAAKCLKNKVYLAGKRHTDGDIMHEQVLTDRREKAPPFSGQKYPPNAFWREKKKKHNAWSQINRRNEGIEAIWKAKQNFKKVEYINGRC